MPKGAFTVTDSAIFRHGVIEYDRELTQAEIDNFQLVPIVSIEDHAALLVAKMGRYAKRYAENSEALNDFIGMNYAHHSVWSTNDLTALASEVQKQASL